MQSIVSRFFNAIESPDIPQLFRTIDWMTLGLLTIVVMIDPHGEESHAKILPIQVCYFSLVALFGLSFRFPIHASLTDRRLYMLVSSLLILGGIFAGCEFEALLYFLIAKGCFLLSRQDLLVMVLAVGIVWKSVQLWVLQRSIGQPGFPYQDALSAQTFIFKSTVIAFGMYAIIATFVLLFSFTILREQRSRARAEQLTLEVEALAATLERSRIARDIHDSLGHTLTALNIQIELAQRLQMRNSSKATHSIDLAKNLASQCLHDVRHAVHSMNDRKLDLNASVLALIQPMQSQIQIQTHLQFPTVPPQISHQIYCIIQEGLTNIQRHAKASTVRLYANYLDDRIIVILEDNGLGFSQDQLETGFGLRSMTERSHLLGGDLKITSHPNQGTSIHLIVPL